MSSSFRLSEDMLISLENRFIGAIPEHLLDRGWDLYRREKVISVQNMDQHSIYGVVKAQAIVAVTLDTEEGKFSTCTCGYTAVCEHMLAVYYASWSAVGGDGEAEAAHNRLVTGKRLNRAGAAGITVLEEETDPKQWFAQMEQQFGRSWEQCRHSLHPLQQVLTSLKSKSKEFSPAIKRLHWMHAILFVLMQAEAAFRTTDSYNRYYYEMAFSRMTEPWIKSYEELAGELDPFMKPGSLESEALQSLVYFFHHQELEKPGQLHRWETLYFNLWKNLIPNKRFRIPEEVWLKEKMVPLQGTGQKLVFYPLALAFFAFTEGEDEKAAELLGRAPFSRTGVLACSFAEQRLQKGMWPQLEMWMAYIFEELGKERRTPAFGPFLAMCCEADIKRPDQPLWQHYLMSFIPYSYSALSAHWLGRQQYDKWAELQLLLEVDHSGLDVQQLREVAKEAPHVLLPLYHQAIDQAINNRNRQGYKTAVKLMKRLEKLYLASHKQEQWQRYISGIAHKYQRLRALQEELWRGKIIL